MLNRRDIAYTIISRFEEDLRIFIAKNLDSSYASFYEGIPAGVVSKAKQRASTDDFEDAISLLDETDFPDLSEICAQNKNFKDWIHFKIKKEDFISKMSSLYNLRCKIAHVKGNFTAVEIDKLIELTKEVSVIFSDSKSFSKLIESIEAGNTEFVINVPISFNSHSIIASIPNNLPIPDYEYEGGFVGREEDKKAVTKYLLSEKFPVVTITGAGGVGKSSLALNVIYELINGHSKHFDAAIWLSAKENMLSSIGIEDIEPSLKNYDEMLSTILLVLGFTEESSFDDIDSKEVAIETVLSLSNKLLVIVDNLETITDERITNFIIEAPSNIKFLVTSRRGIGQVERRHELLQLKEVEAVKLFRQIANDKQVRSLLRLDDKVIKKYVNKVSCYPLAIKWLIGQIARGKDVNRVIDAIYEASSDISKFCFDQIFSDLSDECHLVLFSLCLLDESPSAGVLEFIVGIDHIKFEDAIEELILVSLVIPEQYANEQQEISRKFSILSLTKLYVRHHLNKKQDLKLFIESKIGQVEKTLTATEKAKREYRYSLNNTGASTSDEKVAAIFLQTASQKYQSDNYEGAIEDYKSAANIAPKFSSVYRNWAVTESQEGYNSEAEKLIEKAQSLNSSDPQIWLIWGNILKKANRVSDSIEKYEHAYNLAPNDIIIMNAYGQACSRVFEYEKADKILNLALNSKDDYSIRNEISTRTTLAENLISWASKLQRDMHIDDAQTKLSDSFHHAKRALDLYPNDKKSQTVMYRSLLTNGNFYKKNGKKDIAFSYYDTLNAIRNDVSNINASMFCASGAIELIKYYIDDGDIDKATSLFNDTKDRFGHVFKRYPNINDAINSIHKNLDNIKILRGYITYVDQNMKYVIITDKDNPKSTYKASSNNFKSLPDGISPWLLHRSVSFIPYETTYHSGENKKARNIEIV